MKPTLVALAAGMGSRFGGLKQIAPVGPAGEWILDYSVHDAVQAGFGKVVFVIREEMREAFQVVEDRYGNAIEVAFAYQKLDDLPESHTLPPGRKKPWGTAHAVYAARAAVDGPFAVINADDFYGRQAYDVLAEFLQGSATDTDDLHALVAYELQNTLSDTGSVSRGICRVDKDNRVRSVEEHSEIERYPNGSIGGRNPSGNVVQLKPDTMVSLNCWGFPHAFMARLEGLLADFLEERGNEEKSEFYLPFAVDRLINEGKAAVLALPCDATWLGVTHRSDLETVKSKISDLVSREEYSSPLWSE